MCRLWLGVTYIKLVLIGPLANHKCLRDPCLSNWLCRQQKAALAPHAQRQRGGSRAQQQLHSCLMTCSASSHAPNATVPRAWRRLLDRMREPLASAGHAGPARQTADRPTVLLPLSYKQVQARFCQPSPGRVSHLLASIHILLQCLNAPKLSRLMDAACLAQCVAPVGRGTCQCDSGVLCPTQGVIAIWSGRKRLGSPEKQGKPAFHTADGFFFACRQ